MVGDPKSQIKESELRFHVMGSCCTFFSGEYAVFPAVRCKKRTLVKSTRRPLEQPRH